MSSLENKFSFSKTKIAATLAAFVFAPCLYAAEIAGRVYFASGSVSVVNSQNQQRSLFKGDLVYAGERIETSSNSRIQLRMTDGGTIVLRPNSSFEITKYSFSKATPELGNVLFNFIKGGARAISGAIGKVNRENYKFNTAVATIGIRGTDYSVSMDDSQKMLVTVSDGKVNVANSNGAKDALEGETFVATKDSAPSLCHNINGSINECNPVLISLDAEDNLSFAKQKFKKPLLENYASYGAFIEAMRRYKSLEQDIERIENDDLLNKKPQKESPIVIISSPSPNRSANILLTLDRLDNSELGNISVENAIGIIENELDTDINQGMINEINDEDILLKKIFKYKLEENTTETTSRIAYELADSIDFKGFIENLFLLNTDTLYGNNMRMQGVEVGNPKINVELGNSIFDAINVQLSAATRNKSYALNLGLNDNNLFSLLDDNKNNNFGGLLSIRQVAIYDRDGLGEKDSIGGFLQIGNGSANDAIVVLTDDNTPIKVSLDLVDIKQVPSSQKFSDLANKTTINVNLQTPKILAKLGSVYIGSFSTITNRDTDSVAVLEEVTDSSFNRKSLIKILEPSQIVLGEATISARLEHTPLRKINRIDDLSVNSNISVFADAFIKSGVSIYNFDLIDNGGSIRGGGIGFSKMSISDYSSQNLTAKLAVYIETDLNGNNKLKLFGGNVDGLVLVLDQLGTVNDGVDLNISNFRVGSQNQKNVGDVQIKGLNINGTKVILRGH